MFFSVFSVLKETLLGIVGRGPVPRHAAVYRNLARDRLALRYGRCLRSTVGRGPVPRRARDDRMIARDRPSRYGMGKAIGPSDAREGQALALRYRRVSVYRRAGACPPPCCGLPKPREGQALALRNGGGGWDDRTLARDRPSRYGIEDVSVYRRAGACPPPCCGLPKTREGQALALRYRGGCIETRRSRLREGRQPRHNRLRF